MNLFIHLFYSAERDGCSNKAFHEKCNYHNPVLAFGQNTAGYLFGGYAPVPWVEGKNIRLPSAKSFLFRLRKDGAPDCMKFAAVDDQTAIVSYPDYGPYFGKMNDTALRFFSGTRTKKPGEDYFACNVGVWIKDGYQTNGQDNNNALHGGCNNLINIEVYTVQGS